MTDQADTPDPIGALLARKHAEVSAAIERRWSAEMRGWFPDAPPGQFGPADPALAALSQSEPTKETP